MAVERSRRSRGPHVASRSRPRLAKRDPSDPEHERGIHSDEQGRYVGDRGSGFSSDTFPSTGSWTADCPSDPPTGASDAAGRFPRPSTSASVRTTSPPFTRPRPHFVFTRRYSPGRGRSDVRSGARLITSRSEHPDRGRRLPRSSIASVVDGARRDRWIRGAPRETSRDLRTPAGSTRAPSGASRSIR